MTTVPPWLPDTAPHPAAYPTSADLAAFRRAIRPDLDDLHPDASPDMAAYHAIGAAWSSEVREGIGYPAAEHRQPVYVTDPADPRSLLVMSANDADRLRAVLARREASAMRSRAFGYHPDAFGAVRPGAMACEIQHGTPTAAWDAPDWWDCNR